MERTESTYTEPKKRYYRKNPLISFVPSGPEQRRKLDALGAAWGVNRSEALRRLIDNASIDKAIKEARA